MAKKDIKAKFEVTIHEAQRLWRCLLLASFHSDSHFSNV